MSDNPDLSASPEGTQRTPMPTPSITLELPDLLAASGGIVAIVGAVMWLGVGALIFGAGVSLIGGAWWMARKHAA